MKDMNALRRNLRAVGETRQITNAMFLLSTSRMKRCLARVEYNKTYIRRIRAAVADILQKSPEYFSHDLFEPASRRHPHAPEHAPTGVKAFLILSSDKGMCGGYNTDIVSEALARLAAAPGAMVEVAGLNGMDLLREHGITPDVEWFIPALEPALFYARQIGEHLVDMYRRDYIDEAYVIYTDYESSVRQTVRTQRILPLDPDDFAGVEPECRYNAEMLYEPNVGSVFENLMTQYTVCMLHELINLALASEHCARRNAMQSATDNADEMLKSLTVQINQARQLAITSEITEIAAATEIIEKAI